ncbi:hypothetical protein G9A89_007146 [Geosiphon pyriformis]|nr:hypothetical protein G9A89_007146 [Geosiphon pyriformis]
MKKIANKFGSGGGFRPVLSRKKRKGVTLKESVGGKRTTTKVPSGCSWSSKTGNTTESKSIDMKKECLVKKTSFDYNESSTIANKNYDQMPKRLGVKTKKALAKPLGKINFSNFDVDDDVLLDASLELPPLLKNLVSVSVRKSFALDISLDNVVEKSAQDKLVVIKKLFSKINATFTSELGLIKATNKITDAKIMVNTDYKKSTSHSDWTVVIKEILIGTSAEAVHAVLSKFGAIKSIKMQLVELWQKAIIEFEKQSQADLLADRWSILIRKNVVHIAKSDLDKVT